MSFRIAIVGSGVMARTLARALSYRGDQVALLSPNPTRIQAIWIDCDAVTGRGLRHGLAGVDAAVYAAAGRTGSEIERLGRLGAEQVARSVLRAGVRRMVILGPAGGEGREPTSAHLTAHLTGAEACGFHVPDLRTVRLPTIFGVDDHFSWSWVTRSKAGRGFRAAHRELALRPMWAGDAARVVLGVVDGSLPPQLALQGPEKTTLGEMADAVRARFSTRPGLRDPARRPTKDELVTLNGQSWGQDDWNDLGLGERKTFGGWLRGLTD